MAGIANSDMHGPADPVHAARVGTVHAFVMLGLLLLAGLAGCRSAAPVALDWRSPAGRDHPLTGRIWDVQEARFIDEATLLRRLYGARFVLLGEMHDNVDHHVLQARVLRGGEPRDVSVTIGERQQ